MKNWKTTLAGILAGLPIAIDAIMQAYTAGYFTDKSGWQLAFSISFIILGAVLKDKPINTQKIIGGRPNEKP